MINQLPLQPLSKVNCIQISDYVLNYNAFQIYAVASLSYLLNQEEIH